MYRLDHFSVGNTDRHHGSQHTHRLYKTDYTYYNPGSQRKPCSFTVPILIYDRDRSYDIISFESAVSSYEGTKHVEENANGANLFHNIYSRVVATMAFAELLKGNTPPLGKRRCRRYLVGSFVVTNKHVCVISESKSKQHVVRTHTCFVSFRGTPDKTEMKKTEFEPNSVKIYMCTHRLKKKNTKKSHPIFRDSRLERL